MSPDSISITRSIEGQILIVIFHCNRLTIHVRNFNANQILNVFYLIPVNGVAIIPDVCQNDPLFFTYITIVPDVY